MSWRALAYVETLRYHYDGEKLTLLEKMILDRIAYRHNGELRYAQVGTGYLADQCLCSERSVLRAIKSCERHLTILVTRARRVSKAGYHFNETNMYFFTEFEVKDGTARGREISRSRVGGGDTVSVPPTDIAVSSPPSDTLSSRHSVSTDKLCHQGGDTVSPNSSLQRTSNPKRPATDSVAEPPRGGARGFAAASLNDKTKEEEDRRKLAARDRRREMEAKGVPRSQSDRDRQEYNAGVDREREEKNRIDDMIAAARAMAQKKAFA